tara:strand:+ start:4813 stop:5046 length:234 start_codon:yes stop_codon:yes gene_type:complete
MSTISELRSEAQSRGEELVKRFQELEKAQEQILVEKSQIKSQVDAINGEIAAYNKIEPPVTEVETTQPSETELKSVS